MKRKEKMEKNKMTQVSRNITCATYNNITIITFESYQFLLIGQLQKI